MRSTSRKQFPCRKGRSLYIVVSGIVASATYAAAVQAQTGACCPSNGVCQLRDEATCTAQGSDYMGDDVPCSSTLCRGGCCRPNGTCSENIPRLNCESNGGSYRGHESNCSDASCPVLPNGACCREAFCQEGFTQSACPGVWPGDGTTCADCPGACCLKDDSCVQSTRGECTAIKGATFGGNLTICPPDGCGVGACCFASIEPSGKCSGPIDPFNCAFSGGRYQGHGTDCDTLSCPPFGGGCCCVSSCFFTTQEECASLGCSFMGEGIACGGGSSCPGDGACCPSEGEACYTATGRACVDAGDLYRGEGTSCTPDPCAPFCMYRVTCLSGDCTGCGVTAEGQECKDVGCPTGTCAGGLVTRCPNAESSCCIELELTACRPPGNEPPCPEFQAKCACDPQAGACCLANGGCSVTTAAGCVGTFIGEGTSCDPVQACCDEDLGCTERAKVCCEADGLRSASGGCSPQTVTCMHGDKTCAAANETCCTGEIGSCCQSDDACTTMEAVCCLDSGGTAVSGVACSSPTACCLPFDDTCEMLDPLCCALRGGDVIAGEECTGPEACCDAFFLDCADKDPLCCSAGPEKPDGPGLCLPPKPCCDPFEGTACAEWDPGCCELAGGTPLTEEDACGAPTACCFVSGVAAAVGGGSIVPCEDSDPLCCEFFGGVPLDGEACTQEEACCTFGGCFDLDPLCCDVVFGIGAGPDTCDSFQACCLPDGGCIDDDPLCCDRAWAGATAGAGSFCDSGTCPPAGETESCCFADETCSDLARPVCEIRGGAPGGPMTRCLGDSNGDGSDDECRTPGDANGDGLLDCDDLPILVACLEQAGPGAPIPDDGDCAHANANDDRTLDLKDVAVFQNNATGGCGEP